MPNSPTPYCWPASIARRASRRLRCSAGCRCPRRPSRHSARAWPHSPRGYQATGRWKRATRYGRRSAVSAYRAGNPPLAWLAVDTGHGPPRRSCRMPSRRRARSLRPWRESRKAGAPEPLEPSPPLAWRPPSAAPRRVRAPSASAQTPATPATRRRRRTRSSRDRANAIGVRAAEGWWARQPAEPRSMACCCRP